MSKLVAKELAETKKAKEKEEVKGKYIKAHVMSILEEAKTNTNSVASVSFNSATSAASSNSVLKSILKKATSKY